MFNSVLFNPVVSYLTCRVSRVVSHASGLCPSLRGWRNTVEIVLSASSYLMKPYPAVFQAYISTLRPVMGILGPIHVDEASNRIPPTSHERVHRLISELLIAYDLLLVIELVMTGY